MLNKNYTLNLFFGAIQLVSCVLFREIDMHPTCYQKSYWHQLHPIYAFLKYMLVQFYYSCHGMFIYLLSSYRCCVMMKSGQPTINRVGQPKKLEGRSLRWLSLEILSCKWYIIWEIKKKLHLRRPILEAKDEMLASLHLYSTTWE